MTSFLAQRPRSRTDIRTGIRIGGGVGRGVVLVLAALLQLVALSALHGAPVAHASPGHLGGHHAHHHHGDAHDHDVGTTSPVATSPVPTVPERAAGRAAADVAAPVTEPVTGQATVDVLPEAAADTTGGDHQHEPHQHVDLEPTADAAAVRSATSHASRVPVTAPVMTPATVVDRSSRPD